MNRYEEALVLLAECFGRDSLISVATTEGVRPHVRLVNGYYAEGAFYVVTDARSNKMRQIAGSPEVALCGEWFTGHGVGEHLGHVRNEENAALMGKLREAFAGWYGNGHVDESDPNICLLRIRLTDGVLMHNGTKYELDFIREKA